jgi:TDG/mug DNA glycosylase family protein
LGVPTPSSLRDVAAPGLRVLFVGINPSSRSAELGHHFSGRGNPFWRLLHAVGLTPAGFGYERDADLIPLGLGITNVCPRPTRSAADLERDELLAGAAVLRDKVAALRPEVVAIVGISLYPLVFPGGREPGPGAKRARLAGARVFVLPNPSGLNAAYPGFEAKRVWFERLRRFADRRAGRAPPPAIRVPSRRRRAAPPASAPGGARRGR